MFEKILTKNVRSHIIKENKRSWKGCGGMSGKGNTGYTVRTKRKFVLHNKRRFITFVVCCMVAVFTFTYTTSVHGCKEPSYRAVKVEKGDTLWSIAQKYGSGKDVRKYIHEIKKINHMQTSDIFQGDTILVFE